MKSRTAFEVLASFLLLGCGGAVFTFGETTDAGADVSSGGTVGSATVGTTGTGVGGSAETTTGTSTGSAGSLGTGGAGTTTTTGGGAAGTVGTGGSAGTGGRGGAGGAGGGAGKAGAGGASGADGGIDWGVCGGPGQCIAALTGCCGPCGMPELPNFAGVNPMYIDAFHAATCPVPTPCPACVMTNNPYIGARCVGTRCQPFDTRSTPEFSRCASNADCRLRKGLDCCECGSPGEWTAVSLSGASALSSAQCAPQMPCAACLPVPPANLTAVCTGGGHCEVAMTCALTPRTGCCFSDSQCMGRCYGATCLAGSEGVCKALPAAGQCWGNQDCPIGMACSGARVCPCGAACLLPDLPGMCR